MRLILPDETLEAIAARAAEMVLGRSESRSPPWLTRREAAEYLRLPLSRLEKDRTIPCHRHGRRVLYYRRELDEHIRGYSRLVHGYMVGLPV